MNNTTAEPTLALAPISKPTAAPEAPALSPEVLPRPRIPQDLLESLPIGKLAQVLPHYRDVRRIDRAEYQLLLYKLCPCKSGKKFKFCCRGKTVIDRNPADAKVDLPSAPEK